jgi:hypothetical protein
MPSKRETAVLVAPGVEDTEQPRGAGHTGSPVLLGQVRETVSSDHPGRAKIRWQSTDGVTHERWLAVVKGLGLSESDTVLMQWPANGPDLLVTHVIAGADDALADRTTLDARVDGQRITIEGRDEIVLRCGEASITLRRNGRLVIRGVYVEARARGTNRIKGGSVLIN